MRDKEPPSGMDEIPAWFMTYSDVITLLMTFFILLLTFSTNEPEKFEKIQISMFGGGGATGIAGPRPDGIEKDSFVSRVRPRAARMTSRGSEMPSTSSAPVKSTVATGVAGLEQDEFRDLTTSHAFDVSLALMTDDNGDVGSYGRQHLRMMARQLRRMNYEAVIGIEGTNDVARAVRLARYLTEVEGIVPGQIAIRPETGSGIATGDARLTLIRSVGK